MITQVKKWGNSLAVRLPKEMLEHAGLSDGSRVEISYNKDSLILKISKHKVDAFRDFVKKMPPLELLLEGVTPENIHPEVDWGKPVGNEVW